MNKPRVYIGTSGYSYQHWRGVFYPKELSQGRWLEYYTAFFETTELNVTFYRLPAESAFSAWHRRTPDGFNFAVKGSRFITHIKKLKDAKDSLGLFFSRLKLLKHKLGPVLWQLPPSFKADAKRLYLFLKDLKKYRNARCVFEFRNETWYSKKILTMLKSENVGLCSADWPECSRDIHTTADFLYLRRHGQGARLYSGCYSAKQLRNDAKIIKKNLQEKRDVYIYFNNDAHGYAVKNALQLKKYLQ